MTGEGCGSEARLRAANDGYATTRCGKNSSSAADRAFRLRDTCPFGSCGSVAAIAKPW